MAGRRGGTKRQGSVSDFFTRFFVFRDRELEELGSWIVVEVSATREVLDLVQGIAGITLGEFTERPLAEAVARDNYGPRPETIN